MLLASGVQSAFLGFTNEGPQPRKDANLSAADNFSKILGNAQLEVWRVVRAVWSQQPLLSPTITATIVSQAVEPTVRAIRSSTMFSVFPDSYQQASGSLSTPSAMSIMPTLQDSWKVTSDLTLNYGVAWDTEAPYQNHQFNGLGIVCFGPGSTQTSNGISWRPSGANLFQGSWLQYRRRRHNEIQSFWSASRFRLVARLRACPLARGCGRA